MEAGLLAGLGKGLSEGFNSYIENDRYEKERAERKKADALTRALQLKQIRESGMDFDPETGELSQTPGALTKDQKELDIFKKKELIKAAIRNQNSGGPTSIADTLTPGEKAVDLSFGKDLGDWVTSGKATTEKNLKRLEDATQYLQEHKNDLITPTGKINGLLPDLLKSNKTIATRDDVRAAAQGALKATLGAQFTEKEGERIMNAAYNEKLSPEENLKKISAAIKEIRDIADEKEARTQYFNKVGSLKGFTKPQGLLSPQKTTQSPDTIQKIKAAKAVGYSDDQIQQYLQNLRN